MVSESTRAFILKVIERSKMAEPYPDDILENYPDDIFRCLGNLNHLTSEE